MSDSIKIDDSILSKNADLSKLAEYQDGTIISRTLLKKDTGTITLFAFSKGQELSSHSAPFDAFVQILDGQSEITIEDNKYKLSAGETIIMPANISHALAAVENFKMLLVMIK